MPTMSILVTAMLALVSCSDYENSSKKNTQKAKKWTSAGYDTIGRLCKEIDLYVEKEKITQITDCNLKGYRKSNEAIDKWYDEDKFIVEAILKDLEENYDERNNIQNTLIEYKHFHAIFSEMVNCYLQNRSRDELIEYLSEPYVNEDGERISKERCISDIIRHKARLFRNIATSMPDSMWFFTKNSLDYRGFFLLVSKLDSKKGSLVDKICATL